MANREVAWLYGDIVASLTPAYLEEALEHVLRTNADTPI